MKRLWIVGASGFGRELLGYARDIAAAGLAEWEIAGFLDDDPTALSAFSDVDVDVAGTITDYVPQPDDLLAIAIENPDEKLKIAARVEARGARFATLVHPSCWIGDRNMIGEGTIFCPSSGVTCDTQVGRLVTFNRNASVGHDVEVGEGTTFSNSCEVAGAATIGRGVFLETRVSVLSGVSVGDYARIAPGTVVTSDVPNAERSQDAASPPGA